MSTREIQTTSHLRPPVPLYEELFGSGVRVSDSSDLPAWVVTDDPAGTKLLTSGLEDQSGTKILDETSPEPAETLHFGGTRILTKDELVVGEVGLKRKQTNYVEILGAEWIPKQSKDGVVGLAYKPVQNLINELNADYEHTDRIDHFYGFKAICNGMRFAIIRDDIHSSLFKTAGRALVMPEEFVTLMSVVARTNEDAVNLMRVQALNPEDINAIDTQSLFERLLGNDCQVDIYSMTKWDIHKSGAGLFGGGGIPVTLAGMTLGNHTSYFIAREFSDKSAAILGPIYGIENEKGVEYKTPNLGMVFYARDMTTAIDMLRHFPNASAMTNIKTGKQIHFEKR